MSAKTQTRKNSKSKQNRLDQVHDMPTLAGPHVAHDSASNDHPEQARSRPVALRTDKKQLSAQHVAPASFEAEIVLVADLKPHPRNYREHPEDQLQHIEQSIREHGFYRNIVIARDGTILAGHGVVETLRKMGRDSVPAIRLDVAPESSAALKVLAGDNALGHLAVVDDRKFTEILKEIKIDNDLLGTGFDDMMLANLLFVTRTQDEVKNIDAAAEWVGMPEYDPVVTPKYQLIVNFKSETDREEFGRLIGVTLTDKTKTLIWPEPREDVSSVKFEAAKQ